MTTRKHQSHTSVTTPAPKAPVKEPGAPPPKKSQQQAGQAPADSGRGQQQGGKGEFGEGNYAASRAYDDGVARHLATHDVEREARDAAPRNSREAEDMERAEGIGRARGRGDDIKEDKNA
jgi:hypothetical protein